MRAVPLQGGAQQFQVGIPHHVAALEAAWPVVSIAFEFSGNQEGNHKIFLEPLKEGREGRFPLFRNHSRLTFDFSPRWLKVRSIKVLAGLSSPSMKIPGNCARKT